MTTKYPCYIQFTDSGQLLRIVHKSGMVIAELILSDSDLASRAAAAHDRLGLRNIPRPPKPYRGELITISSEIVQEEIDELTKILTEMTGNEVSEVKQRN